MILARIFFFLVVCFSVGIVGYLLWDRLIHPILFKEKLNHKLEDAGEDFTELQVDKAADKLRKTGKL